MHQHCPTNRLFKTLPTLSHSGVSGGLRVSRDTYGVLSDKTMYPATRRPVYPEGWMLSARRVHVQGGVHYNVTKGPSRKLDLCRVMIVCRATGQVPGRQKLRYFIFWRYQAHATLCQVALPSVLWVKTLVVNNNYTSTDHYCRVDCWRVTSLSTESGMSLWQ